MSKKNNQLVVFVPYFQAQETIEKCLYAIRRSSFKDYQLIITVDGPQEIDSKMLLRYVDKIDILPHHVGLGGVRMHAFKNYSADVLVNIDADVVIKKHHLTKVVRAFEDNNLAALTGMLSLVYPYENFASYYKNIYMNHIFSKIPDNVSFLYGSFFAVRKDDVRDIVLVNDWTNDTELGLKLALKKKYVKLEKKIKVTHLKKYTILSLLKNDYKVSSEWGRLFVEHKMWRSVGKDGVAFAHASLRQIFSLACAFFASFFGFFNFYVLVVLLTAWLALNKPFFSVLYKNNGLVFLLWSVVFTFIDNIIMVFGITKGFFLTLINEV